ncbi:MAG: NfeD family protein [Nocardioides sp.]|nr:NfeD family protein [Nocardioides sp.]
MTAFMVVGVVGLALLLVSLVVGDLFDGALDALAGDAFSSAVIGAFIAATGFGAAAVQGAVGTAIALPIGLVTGAAFAWFAWWLTRLLRDGSSDATLTTDDTIGRDGRVITQIPADGLGVVEILVGGHTVRLNARAEQSIEPGTPVHVTSVLTPTSVTVAPMWPELP